MPEWLLVFLRDKANSSGIELDDLSKVTSYSLSQQSEWIQQSKYLYFVPTVAPGSSTSDVFWRFYEKLPLEDRAAAKSDAGLPLAKYEAAWVADFTAVGSGSEPLRYIYADPEMQRKHDEEVKKQSEQLTNPEIVRNLTLKIAKRNVQHYITFASVSGPAADPAAKPTTVEGYGYYAGVEGQYGGEKINLTFNPLSFRFPIYSPEREAELNAQNDRKSRGSGG